MSKKFILMQGCPGSGKSFLAKKLAGETGVICSADNYFMVNGHYQFNINKIGEAHKRCQENALDALRNEIDIVIVDNTNTTIKELRSYIEHIKLAQKKGYEIFIVQPETSWAFDVEELYKRNTHNVPKNVIEKMVNRYQKNITVENILGE
jgi:tRNA uridine 5-carbamoylmethylation protein Kti12